jgi:hypothetical protein
MVLSKVWRSWPFAHIELKPIRQAAIRAVADELGVANQTVTDKCTRQLRLQMEEFDYLVWTWLTGEPMELSRRLVRVRPSSASDTSPARADSTRDDFDTVMGFFPGMCDRWDKQ